MYERCLNEAERILAADRDVIVPVKKVWQQVVRFGKQQGFEVPSLVDFEALLEADPRFEFMPSMRELLGDDGQPLEEFEDEEENEEEMERLGFYSGDRVKLRRIELTPELIGSVIRRKVDRTMEALTEAWELRPEGDQETEDQLLEILARTQRLQREVKEAFSEERMKKLSRSFQKKSSKTPQENKNTKRSGNSAVSTRQKRQTTTKRGRKK